MNDKQDKTAHLTAPHRTGCAWKYRLLKDGTLATWNTQPEHATPTKGAQDR